MRNDQKFPIKTFSKWTQCCKKKEKKVRQKKGGEGRLREYLRRDAKSCISIPPPRPFNSDLARFLPSYVTHGVMAFRTRPPSSRSPFLSGRGGGGLRLSLLLQPSAPVHKLCMRRSAGAAASYSSNVRQTLHGWNVLERAPSRVTDLYFFLVLLICLLFIF